MCRYRLPSKALKALQGEHIDDRVLQLTPVASVGHRCTGMGASQALPARRAAIL
jgi:hypothetical protein